jgi:Arc/MetJ-type ribon-helix-helix transcriptional regulator
MRRFAGRTRPVYPRREMDDLLDQLPDELREEIQRRVAEGEFPSATALVAEAIRYYFERHRPEDWEEYVRKDVEWSRRNAG